MRHAQPMRVPVTMRVAQSHIRITTTKALPISNLLSSKATEIIPLSDINDVYNVSTGHDSHEFIIRKVRQGVTMYFSSPYRDAIVKVCPLMIACPQLFIHDSVLRPSEPPRVLCRRHICRLLIATTDCRTSSLPSYGSRSWESLQKTTNLGRPRSSYYQRFAPI